MLIYSQDIFEKLNSQIKIHKYKSCYTKILIKSYLSNLSQMKRDENSVRQRDVMKIELFYVTRI